MVMRGQELEAEVYLTEALALPAVIPVEEDPRAGGEAGAGILVSVLQRL